jgi:hypothetical protein
VVSPVVPPPPPRSPSSIAVEPLRSKVRLAPGRLSSQQAYLWGLGLGSVALGLVNGALVISTGIGVLAYRQLQQLSPSQQQALQRRIQAVVPQPRSLGQQALVLSLMLGASTYTVTALWQNTHSLWMALVLTGQTALTFFIVVALLRSPTDSTTTPHPTKRADADGPPNVHGRRRSANTTQTLDIPVAQSSPRATATPADRFEQALAHLTQTDPLQRLIAVRQLVRLVHQAPDGSAYIAGAEGSMQSHLIDCFHILLAHEPEPIVRSAVREGLALLRQPPPQGNSLPAGSDPLPDLSLPEPDPWADPLPTPARQASPPPAAVAKHPPNGSSPRRTVDYIELEI